MDVLTARQLMQRDCLIVEAGLSPMLCGRRETCTDYYPPTDLESTILRLGLRHGYKIIDHVGR